jgi:heme/copper-type cytochrome/quinol oxidase subunit 4
VLVTSVGSTAFDGAKEGPLFNHIAVHLQTFFHSLGFSLGTALEIGFVIGLLITIAIVTAIWLAGMEGMPPAKDAHTRQARARTFAHALIPIAAGYLVAHYFSLLAYNGQDVWRLASDPLGNGSDLFGGADFSIDYGVVSATGIWYVQVGALVVGHVAALALGHDRALELYGSARAATRSQIVMLVLMVAFTCLGLWLLSAALQTQ